jgi:hypothetical protein
MFLNVIVKRPFRLSLCGSGLIQKNRQAGVMLITGFPLLISESVHCGDCFSDFPG